MQKGELALVEWLRRRRVADPQRVPIGIGDDMAAVNLGADLVLLTADMVLDGVHFDTAEHHLRQIGHKAVACSLSDCAAMAVVPVAALTSVALPRDWSMQQAQELLDAMARTAEDFDCPIVGGDITSWAHPLAVDVSMVARQEGGRAPIRRSGAEPGDGLYVTGQLGCSLAGRHLTFVPRVREALTLAGVLQQSLHAMIDISDGLALDLWRMCQASGCGAELDVEALLGVASAAARGSEGSVLEHVLHDGEDFELLVATSGDPAASGLACGITRIGRVVPSGLVLRLADGRGQRLEPRGYEHFR
jgi:thiamine-monophosphate kinase